jgi:polyisoprenoid-binding protein YceI
MSNTATSTRSDRTIWTLDPSHSQVEFGVRHMMISTVRGYFTGLEGTVHLDEEELSRSSVDVTIDASTIDTRNADRDEHLRSADFFSVEEHPTIRFASSGVEKDGEGFRVPGELTIKGVTRPVVLHAERLGGGTDPWGQERVAFRAETKIDRKDFGLTWNQALEAGGVLVGDEVRITLEVQAVQQGDADA